MVKFSFFLAHHETIVWWYEIWHFDQKSYDHYDISHGILKWSCYQVGILL